MTDKDRTLVTYTDLDRRGHLGNERHTVGHVDYANRDLYVLLIFIVESKQEPKHIGDYQKKQEKPHFTPSGGSDGLISTRIR